MDDKLLVCHTEIVRRDATQCDQSLIVESFLSLLFCSLGLGNLGLERNLIIILFRSLMELQCCSFSYVTMVLNINSVPVDNPDALS